MALNALVNLRTNVSPFGAAAKTEDVDRFEHYRLVQVSFMRVRNCGCYHVRQQCRSNENMPPFEAIKLK